VPDADRLYAEWQEIGVARDPDTGNRLEAPMNTDYAMREFAVVDQSGKSLPRRVSVRSVTPGGAVGSASSVRPECSPLPFRVEPR
jgi:hypothetical protein